MPKRFLVVFTRFFPYGYREPYLLNEITCFAEHFTKVYIFVPIKDGRQNVTLPDNVFVIYFPVKLFLLDRIKSIAFLFRRHFWRELQIQGDLLSRRMQFQDLKNILKFLSEAFTTMKWIRKFSNVNKVPLHKTIFFNTTFDERSMALTMLASRYKVKGIFTRYQSLPEILNQGHNRLQLFRALIMKNMDAVFFSSRHSLLYATERYQYYNESKMFIMRSGVPEVAAPNFEGLELNRIKLISVSFIDKYKRVDAIIDALETIEGVNIEWHHIGDGGNISNINQKAFNRLFSKKNINFRFTGNTTPDGLRDAFLEEKPDLFISLSASEDIPISMLEALSYGVPVMTTKVGGISELIIDAENGFLLSENPTNKEIGDMFHAISSISPDRWIQMRKNAYDTWKREADAARQYQDLCYLFIQMSRNYEK